VLFINASQEFEPHPTVRKLNRLGDKHIEKTVKAYKEFEEEEGFSRIVSIDEIRDNDYNLNVTLYVYPIEEEEQIDIPAEWQAIQKVNQELQEVEEKIADYLKELEYEG
ncbi:MAG TPA: SAM-dependent DNA methyltransferase, partial [Archaeoglobus sp.]|nr:SAM-dependent DNA methyltransferase [Archaeoglobus sp.]